MPGIVSSLSPEIRDAEIRELDLALLAEEHVRRLDVAVHDACRVRDRERRRHRRGELADILDAQLRLAFGAGREGLAAHELHDDEAALRIDVVDLHDAGVAELRGGARLAQVPGPDVGFGAVLAREGLDRVVARPHPIVRLDDRPHPALAELLHDREPRWERGVRRGAGGPGARRIRDRDIRRVLIVRHRPQCKAENPYPAGGQRSGARSGSAAGNRVIVGVGNGPRLRSKHFITCTCLIWLAGQARAERMIVTDVRAAAELTDEANAVTLLVRTALADLAAEGDTSKLTVGTAVATLTSLSLDHAVVLELGRNGTGLEVTTTVVDKAGASPAASVVAGDGDVVALAAGVVKQVVAITHATAKPVPEISFGQLRPYAEAMRLAHDDPAGAIAVLDDADPATAAAVGAIHRAINGLGTATTTPAGRLAVARALGAAPDPADIRTILTTALAAQPPNDAKLNQLLTDALGNEGQRRIALAFAASVDHARLTAATQQKLLELAQRAASTSASCASITTHLGLGAALANVDVDGALALVEPRELGQAELDTIDKLLASHAGVPKATATRLRAELAMRRHDAAEGAAIDAYLAAAPMDPRARLYKQLATTVVGAAHPAKPAAAASASNDRREPVLVVIGALLGMGVVLVVLLVLMSFRKPRADKQVPAAAPLPATKPGMVAVRIVIAAEVRQGIAIWTTDRRNSVYTDAAGEATLELAPGDHLLNFESNGEAVTLSVGIGVEPVQRLELELLRAGGSAGAAQEPPPPPPVAPPERIHPSLAPTESPIPMLAPARDSHPAFEDTAHAAPALLATVDGAKLENGADDHRHAPKKAGTFGVAPPPTLSGYAPPPAVPTAIVDHLVPPPLAPKPVERPTPMPPPAKPVEQAFSGAAAQRQVETKPEPPPEPKPVPVAPKPAAIPKPVAAEPTPKPSVPKPITTLPAPKAVDPSPKGLTKPASVVTKPAPIVSKVPVIPPVSEAKPQEPVSQIKLLPLDGPAAAKAMDMELGAAGASGAPVVMPPAASFVLEHTNEASVITTTEAKRLETTGVHLETTKIAEMPPPPATIPETGDAIPPLDGTDTQVRRLPTDIAGVSSEISAITAAPPTLVEVAVAEPAADAEPEERAEPTTVTPMDIPGEPTLVTPEEKSTDQRAKVEVTIVGPPVAPIAPAVPKPQKVPIYQKRSPVAEPTGPLRLGNRYEVQDETARPMPGTIVRGFDERLKRHVGIEAYPVLDPIATAKHVGSIAKLEHANLVRVYELIVEEGRPYLITEPLTGKSLDAHIAERGIYPWVEAVALLDSVCAGLEYAHDRSDPAPRDPPIRDRHAGHHREARRLRDRTGSRRGGLRRARGDGRRALRALERHLRDRRDAVPLAHRQAAAHRREADDRRAAKAPDPPRGDAREDARRTPVVDPGRARELQEPARFRGILVGDHAISALALRAIHRAIGALDELGPTLAGAERGHTDRCGHGDRARRRLDQRRPDGLSRALGDLARLRATRAEQHEQELLAADPHDRIARPHRLGEHGGDVAQHLVADRVTVQVVDRLEVIEIHDGRGERRRDRRAREGIVEPVAVERAGQRIHAREALEARDLEVRHGERGDHDERVLVLGGECGGLVARARQHTDAVARGDQRHAEERRDRRRARMIDESRILARAIDAERCAVRGDPAHEPFTDPEVRIAALEQRASGARRDEQPGARDVEEAQAGALAARARGGGIDDARHQLVERKPELQAGRERRQDHRATLAAWVARRLLYLPACAGLSPCSRSRSPRVTEVPQRRRSRRPMRRSSPPRSRSRSTAMVGP